MVATESTIVVSDVRLDTEDRPADPANTIAASAGKSMPASNALLTMATSAGFQLSDKGDMEFRIKWNQVNQEEETSVSKLTNAGFRPVDGGGMEFRRTMESREVGFNGNKPTFAMSWSSFSPEPTFAISGWTKSPPMYVDNEKLTNSVLQKCHEYECMKSHRHDCGTETDDQGTKGRYYSCHAERQLFLYWLEHPERKEQDTEFQCYVSQGCCDDCISFFKEAEKHEGITATVTYWNNSFQPTGMSERLIRSMFDLPLTDLPNDARQDEAGIVQGLAAYSSFLNGTKGEGQKQAFEAFQENTVRQHFPAYGCTLLAFHRLGAAREPLAHLHLLGLDEWAMDLHMSNGGNSYDSTSLEWKDLCCGSVPVNRLDDFDKLVALYLSKVQKLVGDDRSAAGGEKGHQKTPACIEGIIKDACKDINSGNPVDDESKSTSLPRGAFTDVGLHTGGRKRETAWPLARAIIGTFLLQPPAQTEVFKREMLDFQRFILCNRKGLPWWNKGIINKESADLTMQMILSTARLGAALTDGGYEIGNLEDVLAITRSDLDAEVKARDENAAKAYDLPPAHVLMNCLNSTCSPKLPFPNVAVVSDSAANLDQYRDLALDNLGIFALLKSELNRDSCPEVLSWLQSKGVKDIQGQLQSQLVLQTVEQWIFKLASGLNSNEPLPFEDIGRLELIVELYRGHVDAFLKSDLAQARMGAEMLSKELLVVWTSYALIDSAVRGHHPSLMKPYGVSIDYREMQHLALCDRLSSDASSLIAKYLNSKSTHQGVFCLPDDATRLLAQNFCRGKEDGGKIMEIWSKEKEFAAKRKSYQWTEIQRKKRLYGSLDDELTRLQRELAARVREATAAQRALDDTSYSRERQKYNQAEEKRDQTKKLKDAAETAVSEKEEEMKKADKPPPAVIQPLPSTENEALTALFILYMPSHFRTLSRMSFMAQQMLLPRAPYPDLECVTEVNGFEWNWVDHYNEKQPVVEYNSTPFHLTSTVSLRYSTGLEGSSGKVVFGSRAKCREQKSFPTSVRAYDDSTGVWHPDFMPEMGWSGGGFSLDATFGCYFNPWAPPSGEMTRIRFYTARAVDDKLQAAFYMDPGFLSNSNTAPAPDRGNMAIAASPKSMSQSLSVMQNRTLFTLRHCPLLQARQLCKVLHDRSLPFENPDVRLIIQQLLYQIGCIEILPTDNEPHHVWKWDLSSLNGDALQAIGKELLKLVDELAQRKRDHEQLLVMIDIATYIRHWSSANDGTEKGHQQCVKATQDYSALVNDEIAKKSDLVDIDRLKADRALFSMYTVLAYGGIFALNSSDIEVLLNAKVRAFYGHVYQKDARDATKFGHLKVTSQNVMDCRLEAVLTAVVQDGRILSSAVNQIVELPEQPHKWIPVDSSSKTACFELATKNQLFSINVRTGCVLINGMPPQSLPRGILEHPLYKRTFDSSGTGIDFEVSKENGDILRTNRPLAGFHYEFLLQGDRLIAKEILQVSVKRVVEGEEVETEVDGTTFELLESEGSWAAELPERLKKMHSHWLDRESHTLVLRPVPFQAREIDFFAKPRVVNLFDPSFFTLNRVPKHLRIRPLAELQTTNQITDQLVIWPSGAPKEDKELLRVLSKFESSEFIHVYRSTSQASQAGGKDTLKLEFPRYSHEFEVIDGQVIATSFSDRRLAQKQQLTDTLRGLMQYLVFEPTGIKSNVPKEIIVPVADKVCIKSTCTRDAVRICGNDACDARREHRTYQIHARFKELRCHEIAARLQLAAMYAASDSFYPDCRVGMTGAQYAIDLIRRSYIDRPLTGDEAMQLSCVMRHEHCWRTPALYLLCNDLQQSAEQLQFLHKPGCKQENSVYDDVLLDMTTAYQIGRQRADGNPRSHLTPGEEMRTMGCITRGLVSARNMPPHKPACTAALKSALSAWGENLQEIEEKLRGMVGSSEPPVLEPFPFQRRNGADANTDATVSLEADMIEELKSSYELFGTIRPNVLLEEYRNNVKIRDEFDQLQKKAIMAREALEEKMMTIGKFEPTIGQNEQEEGNPYIPRRHLFLAANFAVQPSIVDFIRSLWNPTLLDELNPFLARGLPKTSQQELRKIVLMWLRAAALEDKLTMLISLVSAESSATDVGDLTQSPSFEEAVVKELLAERVWSPEEHPEWLAMEVDSVLRIRPQQYAIAREMLGLPGAIVQLNMGEGKTRVILPMLILDLGKARSDTPPEERPIVRLHMLSPLLDEGFDHLHSVLCGGILGRKLMRMPFHRDIKLTEPQVQVMNAHARFCQQEGGVIILKPESRCSLYLKGFELSDEAARKSLTAFENDLPWRDIIDESDAVLRYKYQLIYAVGKEDPLPALCERTAVGQLLLRTIIQCCNPNRVEVASDAMKNLTMALMETNFAVKTLNFGIGPTPMSTYTPPHPVSEIDIDVVAHAVLDNLAHESNYDFALLNKYCKESTSNRKEVLKFITNNEVAGSVVIDKNEFENNPYNQLLALRGYLAFGLLQHCLGKRHKVDYGVDNEIARKEGRTRLAVPFVACDVPSERSEFAHPDCALLFTMLSYQFDGLTEEQVSQAMKMLSSEGETVKEKNYNLWFSTAKDILTEEEATKINCFNKIDPDVSSAGSVQVRLLLKAYGKNVDTIFYWLRNCMLGKETTVFPARLTSNANHIVRCPPSRSTAAVGFSGTNDDHRLLPIQVHQLTLEEKSEGDAKIKHAMQMITATNGLMLHRLTASAEYQLLPAADTEEDKAKPQWQRLLQYAVQEKNVSALIDAGALLAGIKNADAAIHVIDQLAQSAAVNPSSARLKGVVYFDGSWMVRSREGRVQPLRGASILERDAFVIFDESHCRGADMKLNRDAIAVLTLGPKMTKDKLMQSGMRMRQLGPDGQRLKIVAPPDVHGSITAQAASDDTPIVQMLRWIMRNTSEASSDGLSMFLDNFVQFVKTDGQTDKDKVQIEETVELDKLYDSAITKVTVAQKFKTAELPLLKQFEATIEKSTIKKRELLADASTRSEKYGNEVEIVVTNADEECERERELQQEMEEEVEEEIASVVPFDETPWKYEAALASTTLTDDIKTMSDAMSLKEAVTTYIKVENAGRIRWDSGDQTPSVFVTRNFMQTTTILTPNEKLDSYLRDVNFLLLFANGDVLLLSDREANDIADKIWKTQQQRGKPFVGGPTLMPFHVLRASRLNPAYSVRLLQPHGTTLQPAAVAALSFARLVLFNGDTEFGNKSLTQEEKIQDLRQLLPDKLARTAALSFPTIHRKTNKVALSDLEAACEAQGNSLGGGSRRK